MACPVLISEPTGAVVPAPADYDAIVFTSQVAVATFPETPAWREKTAYAVGASTADAARAASFTQTVQTGVDAVDLLQHLSTASFSTLHERSMCRGK